MAVNIFRINYKSDFILTMQSDAGWATPFCIKFWTGAPSLAYFAGWDGTTYVHCVLDGEDPTKLHVQFDDHHLPIGDLKFQIGYHFTVEDFPNNTEDEVINQATVIIDQDGTQMQVMLDLNGETAPEIEFNLPAYANEAQRIANEEQRIANEEQRIAAEAIRIENEESRISEFAQLKHDAESATSAANTAATLANEKAVLAADKAALAQAAAELANAKAQLAADKAALADTAATLANNAATLAQQKADYAQTQGDYAKAQGDYAKDQGNIAEADHERAESDHTRAENDHTAVEVYVDSLGAFDISAYHATGDVLAKYVDLSAALDGGNNIPEAIRKGGMSVKFVQSSDNKYVQYRLMSDTFNATPTNWQGVDDEPTAGSDNLVKSGGVSEKLTELAGGVADVNGSYAISEEWIRVVTDADDRILCGIKVDGSIEWSKGVPTPVREYVDAQIAAAQPQEYDEIVAFLGELINGDSLQELLSEKVDKVDGKSLIDNQFVESGMSDEFIQAVVDADGRILQGIKVDGSPYFPKKELISIEDNTTDYIEATLDNDDRIVEGIKKNGEHDFNAGLGVANIANMSSIEQSDFVEVKVDSDNKILEGTRKDGSKYIGAFDETTKYNIKEIAGGEGNSFSIPLLDSNFTSPVPCKIFNGNVEDDSVKGEDNAKYVFDLNIKEAFNIRFKFKITEDIYNAQKECYIAKLGGQKVLHANPRLLTQFKTTVTYNGEQKDMFWPSFIGGISLNDASVTHGTLINNSNIGDFAFSIRYTGDDHNVTIQNTGSAFILKIGDVTHTLSYTDYPTVAELYTALSNIAGVELSFNDIENRNSNELAIFAESKLVSLCYTGVNGESPEVIQEYWDSGSFYIPYSVGETWHQVEIVNIEDKIYVVCDGYTVSYDNFIFNNFVLGGECGVLFKDFEVSMNSSLDAESTRVGIISGVNPYILIFEGHGLTSKPSHEVPDHTDSLLSTPDRLQHLFMYIKGMGYVPISIEDVADYFDGKKILPKRCFVAVFDDFQLENCLDLKNRAPFTRMGVEPTLAIVSNNADTRTIVYNNQEISFQQANDICKINHFTLVSHTRNHRNSQAIKPSEYINELEADIHDQDLKRIVSNILVFPYGRTTRYLADTMQWIGFRLGINVARDPLLNGKYRNKYNLYREELGLRDSYEYIISRIV